MTHGNHSGYRQGPFSQNISNMNRAVSGPVSGMNRGNGVNGINGMNGPQSYNQWRYQQNGNHHGHFNVSSRPYQSPHGSHQNMSGNMNTQPPPPNMNGNNPNKQMPYIIKPNKKNKPRTMTYNGPSHPSHPAHNASNGTFHRFNGHLSSIPNSDGNGINGMNPTGNGINYRMSSPLFIMCFISVLYAFISSVYALHSVLSVLSPFFWCTLYVPSALIICALCVNTEIAIF